MDSGYYRFVVVAGDLWPGFGFCGGVEKNQSPRRLNKAKNLNNYFYYCIIDNLSIKFIAYYYIYVHISNFYANQPRYSCREKD